MILKTGEFEKEKVVGKKGIKKKIWWRRRESNPRPEIVQIKPLQA
ncbi:MAG: hypothetical protein PWQ59_1399 [Thermoanaerobacterium sp.]|nr:MAG: hypothetical protein XD67_0348 [Thermodesulfobacterium commune]MBZ4681881.1 hypothetical protein [Thermodesulfobacterium sp.]MDI3477874.1 hypothetical protein [Thermoanaerobacterium sp.]MDK2793799.1 hypothetical protein [Caldanaerobacter sp.]MDK2861265.1 hypothetical protein [Thermodesulfobacterium sp.]